MILRTRDRMTTVGVMCNNTKDKGVILASSSDPNIDLGRRNVSCLTKTRLPYLVMGMVHNNPNLKAVRPDRTSCFRAIGNNKRNSCGLVTLTPTSMRRVTSFIKLTFRLTFGCHGPTVVLTSNIVKRVVRGMMLPPVGPHHASTRMVRRYP